MVYRTTWAAVFLVGLLACGCSNTTQTGESEKKIKPDAPSLSDKLGLNPTTPLAEQFSVISSNFETEVSGVRDQMLLRQIRADHTALAMTLAKENPQDPAAAKLLNWVVMVNGRNAHADEATNIIKEKYLDSPDIYAVVNLHLGEETLVYLRDNSPHDHIKGMAALTIVAPYIRAENFEKAEELLVEIVEKYPNIQTGSGTLGEIAGRELATVRVRMNLQVGKVAPDIVGQDTDGQEFKLSDYRGKVVMLDFWGNW